MSHMIGHWDEEDKDLAIGAARAKKHFGTLTPLDAKGKPISGLKIAFFNNRNYRREDYLDRAIGFHLALIPYEDENGKEAGDLAIAYDIVDYQDHKDAEAEFQKKVSKKKRGNPPIEAYDALDILKVISKTKVSKHKRVLKQTAAYLSTSSCKKIYGGKLKGSAWIKDAYEKGKIVELQDPDQPLKSLRIFHV
jgi:hypothetical protein